MQLLLLLLLAGVCCGLQYPLQYHYHYRARVTAGIPGVNSKHAAAADVRADLKVYVTSPSTVIFKLEQVEFGEYNGALECDSDPDEPLPVEYQTAREPPASLLGQSAFGLENGVLVVNEDEEPWVVNVYKAIISVFSVSPLRETFFKEPSSHSGPGAYVALEDSVIGRCNTTYTQHKLTGVAAAQHQLFVKDHVTHDVQSGDLSGDLTAAGGAKGRKTTGRKTRSTGRKTTKRGSKAPPSPIVRGPAINPTVWQVVRSVSLDDCKERVELQTGYGGSVGCDLSWAQCQNLLSRSSNGLYALRGDDQAMRLERADVRGAIVFTPFGYETEHLQSSTRIKVALVSVEPLVASAAPDLNDFVTTSEDSLVADANLITMLVESMEKPGDDAGQKRNEELVVKLINDALLMTVHPNAGEFAPALLRYASDILATFTEERINTVRAALPAQNLDVYWGVLTEVGHDAAITVLLEALRQGQVSAARQVLMFGMLNNNLKSASSLKPLVEFVVAQDLEVHPYKTSQSLINLATLVRRVCLSRRSDSVGVAARQQCLADQVVASLLSFIQDQLQGAETFWKQMVLVQSLVNLRQEEAFNTLLPYVRGAKQCDPMVRAVAMASLSRWSAPSDLYQDKATLILLDILDNPGEGRLLRARALGYLTSWPLSSSAWARLALTTRRPGLRDLAALTYSIIRTMSENEQPDGIQQRQFAQHALQLAKPSSAADRYSSYHTWFKYNFADQIGGVDHMAVIQDPTSMLPSELFLYMERTLGGAVFFKEVQFMISDDYTPFEFLLIDLFQGKKLLSSEDPSESGRWTNILEMLKTDLNVREKVRKAVTGLMNMVALPGMQLFVPFERKMLLHAIDSISGDHAPYLGLAGPVSLYYNSLDHALITVNDVGLVAIVNVVKPTIWHMEGDVSAYEQSAAEYALRSYKLSASYKSQLRSAIVNFIPWSASYVSVVSSVTEMATLPWAVDVELVMEHRSRQHQMMLVKALPTLLDQVTLYKKTVSPYTIISSVAHQEPSAYVPAIKTIYVSDQPENRPLYKEKLPLPYSLNVAYDGDCEPPADFQSTFFKLMRGDVSIVKLLLTPSVRASSLVVSVDLSAATNESYFQLNVTAAHMGTVTDSIYGKDHFEEYELCGQKAEDILSQQSGQQSTDDDYWDQQSVPTHQSADSEFSDFGSFSQQQQSLSEQLFQAETEAETPRPSQGVGDGSSPQLASFLGYLERQAGWKSRIDGFSVHIELKDSEGKLDALEVLGASTVCYNLKDQMETKRVFAVVKKDDPCSTTCMESVEVQPKLNDLDTLELIFAKNLSRNTESNFYSGAKCSEGPFASLTDKRKLTEVGASLLLTELQQLQNCRDDPVDPVAEFHNLAQYDLVTLNLTHRETAEQQCSSVLPVAKTAVSYWFKLTRLSLPDLCDYHTTHAITAQRLADKRWKVDLQVGSTASLTAFRRYPYWIEYANYLTRNSGYQWADYCVMDLQSVTTFDGVRVNTSVAQCPVVAATSCESNQFDKFTVAVATNLEGGLMVTIAAQYKQQFINMDANGVKVNGELMAENLSVMPLTYPGEHYQYRVYASSRVSRVAGHVYRRHGYYKVQIKDTLDVILKEAKVYIKVADRYRGYSCGLCGNLDLEPSNDMVTPNGCLLTQPANFASSWTPSTGFSCFAEQQSNSDSCFKEELLSADYYQL